MDDLRINSASHFSEVLVERTLGLVEALHQILNDFGRNAVTGIFELLPNTVDLLAI